MPEGATWPKIQATRDYGAEVRFAGSTVDEALAEATRHSERTGSVLIHPFDHADIVAGQATVGSEIAEQAPQARTVVVCTGGGGLLAGVTTAVRRDLPAAGLVGVQAASAAAFPASMAAGHPVPLEHMSTMADGVAVARPGDLPFEIIRREGVQIVTVDEEAISRAVLMCLERGKLVVEPAGAVGVAALMESPGSFDPPVVVTLSGGNVDPLLLLRIVQHGLVAAGRYMVISVRIPDSPGHLDVLLGHIGQTKGNVVTVAHNRTDPRLRVDECEVVVEVEVRGPEHAQMVVGRLRSEGFDVTGG
jgi:threonine dehydratase